MKDVHIIQNGTVIDHLPSGMGLRCFEILKKQNIGTEATIIFMNMPSSKCEKKDMVKIQDYTLDEETSTAALRLAKYKFSIKTRIVSKNDFIGDQA